ncbi:MAG: hypothetical protein AB7V46_14255 [Thermomicrobiales bacterium]
MNERHTDELWIPDNEDGSGWAEVDWISTARGSRYFYRHAEPVKEAVALRAPYYRVVTRLDTPLLNAPHENSYYVRAEQLADFLSEMALAGGEEFIWHIEPAETVPPEANVGSPEDTD